MSVLLILQWEQLLRLTTASSKSHATAWPSLMTRRLQTTLAAEAGKAVAEQAARAAATAQGGVPGAALTAGLPVTARRQLAWWLGGCSAWVFSMVVLGGVTRLTRSGLSMTDWKFTGERPPLTKADWEAEFAKYQSSPEFKLLHSHMTVHDFKYIYWMEYAHRMWGRILGLAFVIPGSYFLARGYINGALGGRLGLLFLMGGAQGLVGWWMVRSGLEEPKNQFEVPRVSPYRLTAHLTSAFAIYATLVWTTLSIVTPQASTATATHAVQQGASLLRSRLLPVSVLVGITAVSGAFVAGLDAGRAYNTFPLMNGQLIPDDYWALPGLCNAFENTAAVQLHHRALAVSTLAAVGYLWATGSKLPLPRPARLLLHATAAMTAVQVTLGISTLLTYVPVSLGATHQAGALTLFTIVLALLHVLRPAQPSATALLVSRLSGPAALAATAGVAAAVTQKH
eukprot:jgi/Chrzof1/6703/Cz19g06070.t1